jgi:enterochelin esterase-like enzyme
MKNKPKLFIKYSFILQMFLIGILSCRLTAQDKIIIGPNYKLDPLLTDMGNPKGNSFEFKMPLAESNFFRGDDITLNPNKPMRKVRTISVYIPAAYKNGTDAPVLITFDGPAHFDQISNALDNLTFSEQLNRKLPAFILVSVENGGDDAKGSERGLEYDTMSDRLACFINDEVIPAVINNQEIKEIYPQLAISDNPRDRAVMGCSSGGAAAFTMGWFRPDLFRRIISYSGTFVDQQDDDAFEEAIYPLGAWEYHSGIKLIENNEKKPLRIMLHVSENDLGPNAPEDTHHNWIMANERMAEALKNKGYDCRFVYSLASRHCDSRVFDYSLAETLLWIWQ